VAPPPEARAADIARAGGAGKASERPQRPPQARPRAAAPGSARAAAYTVLRGDTISDIALRHGMTAKDLVKYDGGTGVPNIMRLRSRNAHVVHPGEVILVPRRGE
jgi:LysM repeat protein